MTSNLSRILLLVSSTPAKAYGRLECINLAPVVPPFVETGDVHKTKTRGTAAHGAQVKSMLMAVMLRCGSTPMESGIFSIFSRYSRTTRQAVCLRSLGRTAPLDRAHHPLELPHYSICLLLDTQP